MEKIIRFFKTAGVYLLGNVFTKMVSFFLLPLYTSRIEPRSYGVYGLVITILNVAVPIVFFSIWDSVFRFSFDYEDDNGKYQVLNNGFAIMLSGAVVFCIGIVAAYLLIGFDYPILICLYSLAMGFQYYYTVIARALQDNNLFVVSGCVNSVVSIIINIVLIVALGMGVDSLYISYIIGVIVQICIIEYKKRFLSYISLKTVKVDTIKQYLKFSIPVTISAISNWLLNGLTQVFITYQLGSYYNGLYNVANKFSSILILGIGVFQFAWNEMAYDLAKEADKNIYYKRSISEILRISLIGLSVLLLLVKLIYPFMVDDQYNESLNIIPMLLIGTLANAYAGFLGTLFLADKKSLSLFTTTLFAGIVNLVGLNIFIPLFGFIGSILSLCLAFVSYSVVRVVLLKKEMNIAPYIYSIYPILLLFLSVAVFYLVDSRVYLVISMIVIGSLGIFMARALLQPGLKMIRSKQIKS